MSKPTIDLSPDGQHFIIRASGGNNTTHRHQFSVPISARGMFALRQYLQNRQQHLATAQSEPGICTQANPTQHIIDIWLKQHSATTADSIRQDKAMAELRASGIEPDDIDLSEFGI